MKKINRKYLYILAGLAALVILGFGLFVGRNFIADASVTKVEQDESLSEMIDKMMIEANGEKISSGQFVDIDAIHKGTGEAAIFTTDNNPILVFGDDFNVTNGPDLVVYLSENNVAAGEDLGEFVSLNELKSASGAQAYSLPENYQDFKSVVVWCRAFGVLFSAADLEQV